MWKFEPPLSGKAPLAKSEPTGQEGANPSNPEIAQGITALGALLQQLKDFVRIENDHTDEADLERVVKGIVDVGVINDPRGSRKLTDDDMKGFKKTALERIAELIETEAKTARDRADEAGGESEVAEEDADEAEKQADETKSKELREKAEELKLDAEWFERYEEYLREAMDDLKTFAEEREADFLVNFNELIALADEVIRNPAVTLDDARKVDETLLELKKMSNWFLSEDMSEKIRSVEFNCAVKFGSALQPIEDEATLDDEIDADARNVRYAILDRIVEEREGREEEDERY